MDATPELTEGQKPMTRPIDTDQQGSRHFFTAVDGWFYGLLLAEVLSMSLFPLLPLLVAAVAFLTPLRRSPWRLAVVVTVGVILGAIVLAPFVFGTEYAERGPGHVGRP